MPLMVMRSMYIINRKPILNILVEHLPLFANVDLCEDTTACLSWTSITTLTLLLARASSF